jgi:D-beta-D-heptose 7-phosphate kinase/D-beta-D-heptose 1-phosphate adenosyltransferase
VSKQPPSLIRAREKIHSLATTQRTVARAKKRGERIVFTNGCFDLLHRGHVRSLEEARALGDRLIVAVNLDASVRRLKGVDRPIQPAATRMEVVAALACVDWVLGFGGDTPIRPIRVLRPDVLAKGADWADEEIVGASEVVDWGGRVMRLAIVRGERTSDTIERIRQRSPRRKR